MLKLINVGNSLPLSLPASPVDKFDAGMLAELKIIGKIAVLRSNS